MDFELYFFFILILGLYDTRGDVYPSVQWSKGNPAFRNSASMNVLPTNKLMIVCPNPTTVLETMVTNVRKEEMYENLWTVDKASFDSCSVDTSKQSNRLLMQCNMPLQLKYFTLVFRRFSAVMGGLEFQPGTEYYFIATSDGSRVSLTSQFGGRCKTHNMKISFYVCLDESDPKCSQVVLPSITTPTSDTMHPSSDILPTPTATSSAAECSAKTPSELQEMLNNTRLLLHIYKHTEQIPGIFSNLREMSVELDTVRDKLNNCSFGVIPKPPQVKFKSCQELYDAGFKVSAVYNISLGDGKGAFGVYCDQVTDGGGWTVIQKRFNGSVDFQRNWTEYEAGFGTLDGEFWLGLDKIHRLTGATPLTLRFDLGAPSGEARYELYQGFSVKDAAAKYKLILGKTFSGSALDSFTFQKNQMFSTYDQDNDEWKDGSCAVTFPSGWWHKVCHKSGMNGLYSETPKIQFGNGIIWHTWKGYNYGLTMTEMKVKL